MSESEDANVPEKSGVEGLSKRKMLIVGFLLLSILSVLGYFFASGSLMQGRSGGELGKDYCENAVLSLAAGRSVESGVLERCENLYPEMSGDLEKVSRGVLPESLREEPEEEVLGEVELEDEVAVEDASLAEEVLEEARLEPISGGLISKISEGAVLDDEGDSGVVDVSVGAGTPSAPFVLPERMIFEEESFGVKHERLLVPSVSGGLRHIDENESVYFDLASDEVALRIPVVLPKYSGNDLRDFYEATLVLEACKDGICGDVLAKDTVVWRTPSESQRNVVLDLLEHQLNDFVAGREDVGHGDILSFRLKIQEPSGDFLNLDREWLYRVESDALKGVFDLGEFVLQGSEQRALSMKEGSVKSAVNFTYEQGSVEGVMERKQFYKGDAGGYRLILELCSETMGCFDYSEEVLVEEFAVAGSLELSEGDLYDFVHDEAGFLQGDVLTFRLAVEDNVEGAERFYASGEYDYVLMEGVFNVENFQVIDSTKDQFSVLEYSEEDSVLPLLKLTYQTKSAEEDVSSFYLGEEDFYQVFVRICQGETCYDLESFDVPKMAFNAESIDLSITNADLYEAVVEAGFVDGQELEFSVGARQNEESPAVYTQNVRVFTVLRGEEVAK